MLGHLMNSQRLQPNMTHASAVDITAALSDPRPRPRHCFPIIMATPRSHQHLLTTREAVPCRRRVRSATSSTCLQQRSIPGRRTTQIEGPTPLATFTHLCYGRRCLLLPLPQRVMLRLALLWTITARRRPPLVKDLSLHLGRFCRLRLGCHKVLL